MRLSDQVFRIGSKKAARHVEVFIKRDPSFIIINIIMTIIIFIVFIVINISILIIILIIEIIGGPISQSHLKL